jgi:hypothetical protein
MPNTPGLASRRAAGTHSAGVTAQHQLALQGLCWHCSAAPTCNRPHNSVTQNIQASPLPQNTHMLKTLQRLCTHLFDALALLAQLE